MAFQRGSRVSSRCESTYLAHSPHLCTCAIHMICNELREQHLLRHNSVASTFRLPRPTRYATVQTRSSPKPHHAVYLLPCNPPIGALEPAPRTSLRADTAREWWDGFWCDGDERYYTRCSRFDGSTQWYRFADEETRESLSRVRVIPFPVQPRSEDATRQTLFLWSPSGRRSMLVGTSRRRRTLPGLGSAR